MKTLKEEITYLKMLLSIAYPYLQESAELKRGDDLITDQNNTFLNIVKKAISKKQ